jgi:hypothetical protein
MRLNFFIYGGLVCATAFNIVVSERKPVLVASGLVFLPGEAAQSQRGDDGAEPEYAAGRFAESAPPLSGVMQTVHQPTAAHSSYRAGLESFGGIRLKVVELETGEAVY